MFKSLRWLIKFRKNFQNLKKHYQIIIYATKKDFAYYQKKQSLSDYQMVNCTPKVGHKTTFGGAVFL